MIIPRTLTKKELTDIFHSHGKEIYLEHLEMTEYIFIIMELKH